MVFRVSYLLISRLTHGKCAIFIAANLDKKNPKSGTKVKFGALFGTLFTFYICHLHIFITELQCKFIVNSMKYLNIEYKNR